MTAAGLKPKTHVRSKAEEEPGAGAGVQAGAKVM